MFEGTVKKIELNKKFELAVMSNDIESLREMFSADKSVDEMPYIDVELYNCPAIMVAAQNKNWELLEELYVLGADLDVRIMPSKWYLINECITNAPDKVTKAIIDNSNINVQTVKGETPLMVAIKREKGIMAEYMVESGRADLSLVNSNLENAAHYAAREGNYKLFLNLVSKGIPLLRKNKEGKTPIDLIEDISFKTSLPQELDKIVDNGGVVILEDTDKKEVKQTEVVKKVTGLSSIKKKTV